MQQESGHQGLFACSCGFMIDEAHPSLGASPDGVVHDPSSSSPFGLFEIKCPYACHNNNLWRQHIHHLSFTRFPRKKNKVKLKQSHPYYSQVQGQMAIAGRPWCDFVVFTTKGMSIERIDFNSNFGTTIFFLN